MHVFPLYVRQRTYNILCARKIPEVIKFAIALLIGDALTKKGWIVRDIMSGTSAPKHRLTPFLKVRKGQFVYPAPKT